MRRLVIAVLAIGALSALGGGAAEPASAICAISTEGKGNHELRVGGNCVNKLAVGTKTFINVINKGTWIANGIACAQVSEVNTGNYGVANCAGAAGAAGCCQYIKINVNEGLFGWRWWVASADAATLPSGIQVTKLTTAKATLKTKIGGAEVKFTTSTAPELVGVKLEGEGKLTTGGQVKFTGLTTELSGKASAPCTPLGTAGNDSTLGSITSNKTKGNLVSHGGDGVVQVLPETANTFGKLFFGEECSLPEEVPLITKSKEAKGLVLKDPLGIGSELKEHEIAELAALTELWVISETVEHKATVEGKAAVGLTGAHSGLAWRGAPNEFEVS
jgi:hypothetical protein